MQSLADCFGRGLGGQIEQLVDVASVRVSFINP